MKKWSKNAREGEILSRREFERLLLLREREREKSMTRAPTSKGKESRCIHAARERCRVMLRIFRW